MCKVLRKDQVKYRSAPYTSVHTQLMVISFREVQRKIFSFNRNNWANNGNMKLVSETDGMVKNDLLIHILCLILLILLIV